MIARIATFVPMTADIEIEARRNLLERFQPALQSQPGLVAAYWLVGKSRICKLSVARFPTSPLIPNFCKPLLIISFDIASRPLLMLN